MNLTTPRHGALGTQLVTLLGTASLLTMANAISAQAQGMPQTAQAEEVPENVLITGSLIRGTVAVGVPVTNLSASDFKSTGALTTSDLFRTVPQFNVIPGPVATQAANVERGTRVNLRQLDTGSAPRSLMMVDGVRYPPQGNGLCQIDPSIIPEVALDRIDLLLDGASATYGSDALGGVINLILKRNYDGAKTELGYTSGLNGVGAKYLASQMWGRTWDGGGITLSYEWYDIGHTPGIFNSKLTFNHSPYGLDNRNPIGSSTPGTISAGAPFVDLPHQADGSPNLLGTTANNGTVCQNCFAIPRHSGGNFVGGTTGLGPTAPFSASAFNWATFGNAANSGTNGTRNEFNPYEIADYSAAIQYNGGAVTLDQRLTKDISFYGEAFYGNRRSQFHNNATGNQLTVGVPTFNPYYPTGGAPTNLRVSYHFGIESPSITNAYASGMRYLMGLNISLPYSWAGQLYYSMTKDAEFNHVNGTVNKGAVSAALGWTMPVTPASGTYPAVATWTKPANIPYLNVFCDPNDFQCNSPTTRGYIENFSQTFESMWVNEKGIKADGPLFDLPGGTVKAAIGANYTSYRFIINSFTENANANTLVVPLSDPESRQVWAVFAQVNVPIVGEQNSFPLVRKFELEGSWRHDQYSDVGGTSNPKAAFNWLLSEDLGFMLRGSWGTSFRAPNFGEFSPISNVAWNGWGLGALFQNNSHINVTCDPTNTFAPAGSGAAKLKATGFACNSEPAGLSLNGGGKAAVLTDMRTWFNQEQQVLEPEKSTNWSAGFQFAPTAFLKGLDVQATWYSVKINSLLANFGNPTTNRFNDPSLGFVYIVPSDLQAGLIAQANLPTTDPATKATLLAHAAACAAANAHPVTCPEFQQMVTKVLGYPGDTVPPTAQTLIYWINDGGTMNKGWQRTTGIDFTASYDFDAGDFGALNAGITGTYYLDQVADRNPGAIGDVPTDVLYHTDLAPDGNVQQLGVESLPRFKYRARVGWANGPWSATVFMDYASHFYHTQTAPPNVNGQCVATGSSIGGGTFPCAMEGYSNIEPSYYTFDISLGYDTGEMPANEYLRNVAVQLVVQNVFDKHSPYEYRISTGGGNPAAFDILKNIYGRQIQVRITKTW